MSDTINAIDLTVFLPDGTSLGPFNDVQYLSWVNGDTYGIPALISDEAVKKEANADGDVTILYINPDNVAAVKAVRKDLPS